MSIVNINRSSEILKYMDLFKNFKDTAAMLDIPEKTVSHVFFLSKKYQKLNSRLKCICYKYGVERLVDDICAEYALKLCSGQNPHQTLGQFFIDYCRRNKVIGEHFISNEQVDNIVSIDDKTAFELADMSKDAHLQNIQLKYQISNSDLILLRKENSRKEKENLRKEKENLRKEEGNLRKEKENLRKEEGNLRKEEGKCLSLVEYYNAARFIRESISTLESCGYSQSQISKAIGISTRTVRNYKNKKHKQG